MTITFPMDSRKISVSSSHVTCSSAIQVCLFTEAKPLISSYPTGCSLVGTNKCVTRPRTPTPLGVGGKVSLRWKIPAPPKSHEGGKG